MFSRRQPTNKQRMAYHVWCMISWFSDLRITSSASKVPTCQATGKHSKATKEHHLSPAVKLAQLRMSSIILSFALFILSGWVLHVWLHICPSLQIKLSHYYFIMENVIYIYSEFTQNIFLIIWFLLTWPPNECAWRSWDSILASEGPSLTFCCNCIGINNPQQLDSTLCFDNIKDSQIFDRSNAMDCLKSGGWVVHWDPTSDVISPLGKCHASCPCTHRSPLPPLPPALPPSPTPPPLPPFHDKQIYSEW